MSAQHVIAAARSDEDNEPLDTAAKRLVEHAETLLTAEAEVERALRGLPRPPADVPPSAELLELLDRTTELRRALEGLVGERAALESRIAALERAARERWASLPPPVVLNQTAEQRLFVRLRRTIPLPIRKAIVETYRRWSR